MWRPATDANDFSALAGHFERETLLKLGFNLELSGRPIGYEGNGLEKTGALSRSALSVLGAATYIDLWVPDGPVISKAREWLNDPVKDFDLKNAFQLLQKAYQSRLQSVDKRLVHYVASLFSSAGVHVRKFRIEESVDLQSTILKFEVVREVNLWSRSLEFCEILNAQLKLDSDRSNRKVTQPLVTDTYRLEDLRRGVLILACPKRELLLLACSHFSWRVHVAERTLYQLEVFRNILHDFEVMFRGSDVMIGEEDVFSAKSTCSMRTGSGVMAGEEDARSAISKLSTAESRTMSHDQDLDGFDSQFLIDGNYLLIILSRRGD